MSNITLRNGRWIIIAWEHHLQVVKHAEVSKGQTGGIHNKWAQSATYRPLKRVHLRQLPLGEDTQLRQRLTTWQKIIEQTRNKNKQCNYDLERTACNNKMPAKILASLINYISAWLQHFNSKQLNLLSSCSARILFLFSTWTHSLMPIKLFFHGVGSRTGSAWSAQRWTSCSRGAFLEGACKSPLIAVYPSPATAPLLVAALSQTYCQNYIEIPFFTLTLSLPAIMSKMYFIKIMHLLKDEPTKLILFVLNELI